MQKLAAIIVTHNRKELLLQLVDGLLSQSLLPQQIFIVDNQSTDGTELVLGQVFLPSDRITYTRLAGNVGGAGGFNAGIKLAYERGYDWFWLMDDDALPTPDALENLAKQANDPLTIYGSTALYEGRLCWPIIYQGKMVSLIDDLPESVSVSGIPFLGFFIHRNMVDMIGFPDVEFFISGDDIEYCQRAKNLGYAVVMVKNSHIHHPMPQRFTINLWNRPFFLLVQAPWRRYYDIRNRIVIARRHYSLQLYTATLPGIIFRWILTLCFEENRWLQSIAYFRGIKDGLMNRLGKTWGI